MINIFPIIAKMPRGINQPPYVPPAAVPTDLEYSSRSMGTRDSISSVPASTYWGQVDLLYFIGNSANMTTALRFNNLNIPPGSTINSAYITIYSSVNQSFNSTAWANIGAEQVDNASQLASYADHESRKSNVGTTVQWGPHAGLGAANLPFQSADLATVVQQIINRGGWSAGNSIQFFVSPNPSTTADYQFRSYWSGTQTAHLIGFTPILVIDFTADVDPELGESSIDVRTASDGDCSYIRVSPSTSYFVADRLYLHDVLSRDATHFVRWQVNIPKDAIITSTTLTLWEGQNATYAANQNFSRLSFEQVDNSGQVPNYSNGESRYQNEGTNYILSMPVGTFFNGDSHTFNLPPNMLQELVSRTGWSSGNYVTLMFRNPIHTNGTNTQLRGHQGWSSSTTPRLQATYLA